MLFCCYFGCFIGKIGFYKWVYIYFCRWNEKAEETSKRVGTFSCLCCWGSTRCKILAMSRACWSWMHRRSRQHSITCGMWEWSHRYSRIPCFWEGMQCQLQEEGWPHSHSCCVPVKSNSSCSIAYEHQDDNSHQYWRTIWYFSWAM